MLSRIRVTETVSQICDRFATMSSISSAPLRGSMQRQPRKRPPTQTLLPGASSRSGLSVDPFAVSFLAVLSVLAVLSSAGASRSTTPNALSDLVGPAYVDAVLPEDRVDSLVANLFLIVEGADVGRYEGFDAVAESARCLAEGHAGAQPRCRCCMSAVVHAHRLLAN